MNKNNKIILLLLVSSVLLVSCGFHFRGAIKVPVVMQDIYLTGESSANNFARVLSTKLIQLDIRKVKSKENASAILVITKNNFIRRVLTVDAATKASAYKLDLIIGFQVLDSNGLILLNSQQIRQTREYNIDPLNALASGDQESALKVEMVEFVVNQLLTRMSIALRNIK